MPYQDEFIQGVVPAWQGATEQIARALQTQRDEQDRRRKEAIEREKVDRETAKERLTLGQFVRPAVTEEVPTAPLSVLAQRYDTSSMPLGLAAAVQRAPMETRSQIIRPESRLPFNTTQDVSGYQFQPGPLSEPAIDTLKENIWNRRQAIEQQNRLEQIRARGGEAEELEALRAKDRLTYKGTSGAPRAAAPKVLPPLTEYSGKHSVQLNRGVGGVPIRARQATSMLAGASDRLDIAKQLYDNGQIHEDALREAAADQADFEAIADGSKSADSVLKDPKATRNAKLFAQQWKYMQPGERTSALQFIAKLLSPPPVSAASQ